MRWLLSLLLAWPMSLFGAGGDISGVAIETNGWQALVYITGLGTNGTFNLGLGANNSIDGNEKFTITLNSPGFNSSGATTIVQRVVYGTTSVRFPYPSNAFPDTTNHTGSDVTIKLALSDYVYALDDTLSATASGSLYAQGGTNSNAGSSLAVTNLSTQVYTPPVPHWTWPGWNQETGATMRLRALGFHQYAQQGQPLACMEFIVADEAGTTTTNRVTSMQIDRTLSDALPFAEYYADVLLSNFAHSNLLRCDFVAKPWVGNVVFDTRNNLYTQPTPFPSSITNFYNTNTYSVIAVVDPAGNDTNGKATNTTPALVNSAHYFLTVNGALAAIRGTNNTMFGHQDCGGAIAYARAGIVNSMGGSVSMAGTPKCWATVKAYPGDSVTFTNHTGSQDISDRYKTEDITIGYLGSLLPYANSQQLWFNNCIFNSTGSGPINTGCTAVYVTGGSAPTFTQGFKPVSSNPTAFALLRGINLNGFDKSIHFWTMAGCLKTAYSGESMALSVNNSSWPGTAPDWQILYNNSLKGMSNTAALTIGGTVGTTNGIAIVQNEIEGVRASSSVTLFDGSLVSTNVIWMHNTIEGYRQQYFYNESGSSPVWRSQCQAKNSIFTNTGEATDTDPPADGGRIGDWSVRWRAGSSGNIWQFLSYEATHNGLPPFAGLNSFLPPGSTATNTAPWIRYVDRQGYGAGGAGGGNYRLLSDSPLVVPSMKREWVLPYDIAGQHRGLSDPAGAYASAVPRKAAGFFAP